MDDQQLVMTVGTLVDCAAMGHRPLGAAVWATVASSDDLEFIVKVVDQLTLKAVSWLRVGNHPHAPAPIQVNSAMSGGPLDLVDRTASTIVADLVNLGVSDLWEKRAERLASITSMMMAVAAGEQAMEMIFSLPDSTRMVLGSN